MIVRHERSELNLRFRPQKPIDIGVAGNGWVESCRDNEPLPSDKEECREAFSATAHVKAVGGQAEGYVQVRLEVV